MFGLSSKPSLLWLTIQRKGWIRGELPYSNSTHDIHIKKERLQWPDKKIQKIMNDYVKTQITVLRLAASQYPIVDQLFSKLL